MTDTVTLTEAEYDALVRMPVESLRPGARVFRPHRVFATGAEGVTWTCEGHSGDMVLGRIDATGEVKRQIIPQGGGSEVLVMPESVDNPTLLQ